MIQLVLKALGNSTRLKILFWLKEPGRHFPQQKHEDIHKIGVCGKFIHKKSGLSQPAVSQYLNLLLRAELITSIRSGKYTYYKRNEKIIRLFSKKLNKFL